MKKKNKILLALLIVVLLIITIVSGSIVYLISPVSSKSNEKIITIESGDTINDIAHILKEENLIRNETVFIYYARFKQANDIYAASYYLNQNMNLNAIIKTLLEGGHNANEIRVTFNEGLNMRGIANIISKNTNNTYEDVMNKLNDEEYINSLIEKYWFLTKEIKDKDIYYSLEGYLYPDTYFFTGKDVEVEEIFKKMLDRMDEILSEYKSKIKSSEYSAHELLTIASIVELESVNEEDRKDVSSVVYNRLNKNMAIQSDVTTYYAFKIDMGERDLYQKEIDTYNKYNTRGPDMVGKLPVGPVSSVGKLSIEAAIEPNNTDYLFFVADKTGKVYFTKTEEQHEKIIDKLMDEGLWYEW